MISCECCGGRSSPYRRIREYTYRRCASCGYLFLDGDPSREQLDLYGDAYFEGGGAGYEDYTSEETLLRESGSWYAQRLQRFMPATCLLDVGCAAGYLMAGFAQHEWTCAGVEPNARMASIARAQGFHVHEGALESIASLERFDLISMIQVVAHFYDLHSAFRAASDAAAPNGSWLVETWNARSLTARFLGAQWHEFSPPSVLRIFTPAALDALAARYGFFPVAGGRPRKRILAEHAKSLLAAKARDGRLMRALAAAARVIPDKTRIPYPGEDLFWRLYRRRTQAASASDFPGRHE